MYNAHEVVYQYHRGSNLKTEEDFQAILKSKLTRCINVRDPKVSPSSYSYIP